MYMPGGIFEGLRNQRYYYPTILPCYGNLARKKQKCLAFKLVAQTYKLMNAPPDSIEVFIFHA